MKRNKKGFTLAELLIVVAIISVLIAIAIPIFNAQLERSRDAASAANMRAAYAEAMIAYTEGTHSSDRWYSCTIMSSNDSLGEFNSELPFPFEKGSIRHDDRYIQFDIGPEGVISFQTNATAE